MPCHDKIAAFPGKACPRGFTVIELMIAMAVLAVLVTLGLPSFTTLVQNNRLTTASLDVQGALNLAESEAVMRHQPVSVCPSTDGATCSGGTNWNSGLLVFTDAGATPGSYDNGASDQLLRVVRFDAGSGLSISASTANGFTRSSGGTNYIRFLPQGTVANAGTLTFCDARTGTYGLQLAVFVSGLIQSSRQATCPATAS